MASTRWCFTVNNYSLVDETLIQAWDTKYLVYGKEVGESGTPHLQGFVTFPKLYRLSGVKKLHTTAHWERTKGTSLEAATYCKKEDANPFERGTPPTPGQRTDLDAIAEAAKAGASLLELSDMNPSMYIRNYRGIAHYKSLHVTSYSHQSVRGVWFYGKSGTGKSHAARTMYPNHYIKSQNKWFDGYTGEAVILLEDFDYKGQCLDHYLKIWLDKYPCTAETKGGKVQLQHRVFIITSNYTPTELFGRKGNDKENGQDEMVAAINRRIQFFEFKKVFEPPPVNQAGPGNWLPEVDPPLPVSFYDETAVDP